MADQTKVSIGDSGKGCQAARATGRKNAMARVALVARGHREIRAYRLYTVMQGMMPRCAVDVPCGPLVRLLATARSVRAT